MQVDLTLNTIEPTEKILDYSTGPHFRKTHHRVQLDIPEPETFYQEKIDPSHLDQVLQKVEK